VVANGSDAMRFVEQSKEKLKLSEKKIAKNQNSLTIMKIMNYKKKTKRQEKHFVLPEL
jgi:hypothetical protein